MGQVNTSRRRCAAALVSAALISTALAVVTPGTASAAPPVPAGPGAAQAGNTASALLMARLQNRAIEVMDARTDASQTFANPNGSLTYTAFAEPKWVKRAGAWTSLDATLTASANGTFGPAASESPLSLSAGGSGPLATMTVDGKQVSLTWPTALPRPTVSGAVLTYPNVLASGVDLQVTATVSGGVEETLIVKNSAAAADPALADLVQAVNTGAGTTAATDAGGNLTVADAHGKALLTSPAPVMWDSSTTAAAPAAAPAADIVGGADAAARSKVAVARTAAAGSRSTAHTPGSRAHQARVKATLKNHQLHLAADHAFLTAKTTVYPVYVDPAYVPHPASGATLHYDQVQQAYPSTSNYDAAPGTGLAVGYQGFSSPTGIERTFYSMSIPTAIYGSTILGATFNTKVTYAAASGSNSTTVNAFSMASITSATNWSNQPAKESSANPNYPSPNASATFTTTSSSPNQAVAFNVTSGMQKIADIHNAGWTMGLFNATETNDVDLVRFSANPTFSITYDHSPATPANGTLTPSGTGYPWNTTTGTPTLSATATDADSDTVQLNYQILSGSTVKATGTSAFVTPGAAATWKPTTALPDGAYSWSVRSYDGHQYSAWSGAMNFTVDTAAPANTTVTSTDFPGNSWSGTPDASGNFTGNFTMTPPSSDTSQVAWQLDNGAWNYTATTGAAFTKALTFTAGKHTLIAKTHDAAGNMATGTYYIFYAGSGAALTAPGTGERPARRVGLMAQGQASYTGVTYQYRIGATDTWHNVPLANVTKNADGSTPAAWPVAATGGTPAALTWNISDSLADGPVDVRALFTDGTTTAGSPANTVTVDRNAGTAPSLSVGPASVNSLTGDASLTATDASAFGMSVTRSVSSRRPSGGSAQSGQAAVFGPQWSAGTTAEATGSNWSYLKQTSATSVSLVDTNGNPTGFTAAAGGGWKPEPGAEDLALTGSLTGSFAVKNTDGVTTTFTKPDSSLATWQVSATFLSSDNSTTTVTYQTVTVNGVTLARPKYVIAPTSATDAATCQTTTAAGTPAAGCRVLEYLYATATTGTSSVFADFAGQVKEVKLWSTAPGDSTGTVKVLAHYNYDDQGRLREVYDPRISPALKTSYSYDAAGRVATQADPGQLPWTFAYGKVGTSSIAGDGMLLSASRPTLTQGSNTQTDGGTATTTVVYNVPLSGSGAPNAMGGADTAAWAQSDAPTDATAVFPADQVPASNDGSTLGAGGYNRATITYTDASGREVNTATPGGHITTTQYDQYGNTVFQLGASNRELALGTAGWQTAEQQSLDIDQDTTVQRAQLLSTTSLYNTTSVVADTGTDKNTDPAVVGQRLVQQYEPIHLVTLTHDTATSGGTLTAGTQVPSRQHTLNTYDQGRPNDGTATTSNQITTAQTGAVVAGAPDGDTTTNTAGFDWVKGLATSGTIDPSGLKLTSTTGYDTQGRVVSTSLPKSTGSDAGTTVTSYWSATGTGACHGRPEWADLVCSTGPAAAATGGGSNPAQLPTRTTTYDRYGNVATVTDTANGVTRTTTNTYGDSGRLLKTSVTGGVGTAVPDTTIGYDSTTGKKATVTANGLTITYTYDALGRQTQYTDGAGGGANTSYDILNRPVTVTDGAPSTTHYTYNTAGQVATLTDSVAGTTSADYDSDGNMYAEHLPGGITLTIIRDQVGQATGRIYTRDSDGTEVTADYGSFSVAGQEVDHTADAGVGSHQAYGYDAAGRLVQVADTEAGTTTHRGYSFDANTNRTGLTTSTDNSDGSAGTPATTAYTYDTADRLQSVNGSAVSYDAFGRTTNQADGTRMGYYTNDTGYQDTNGNNSQTWNLDPAGRVGNTQTTAYANGTWTLTDTTTNHYTSDSDSPDWAVDSNTGGIHRYVQGIDGDLAAVTAATDSTSLQLTNLHGDVTVQLPLDSAQAPVVQAADEYGNLINATSATTYGWIGAKQRASGTPSGLTLMGARLYNPATGRFLQIDPVLGGNENAYTYPADPVMGYDLTGMFKWTFGWFSGTLYLNKKETSKIVRAAGVIAIFNSAATLFAVTGLGGVILKWIALNAAVIAWKASGASSRHHCIKLKWPIGYPGLIPGEYSGGYCK
ncbi:RHS repeat-associated core domain-containing protein [Streptacidiphilus sp. N1-3]|uniref:RHS repeat-associated core domain-containing protein n=1 Tax=Streptacidiphilus alkalitolerans TaxID=3342712 RepID=A0ABV6XE15_9ACTN